MSVHDKLARARYLHFRAKSAAPGAPKGTRRANFRELIVEARQLRAEAAELDPERSDPAWREEQYLTPGHKDTHEALMRFYDEVLGA